MPPAAAELPRLVCVVGTTASGKSALGVRLARLFGGEVVSADSRQVYRGLDLGTGKLTTAEMAGVPHHLIDVAPVAHRYSLAEFQQAAYAAIDGILARGRVPLLVGGTGLYVRAVAQGYDLAPVPPDPALREHLETLDGTALAELAARHHLPASTDLRNRRRVVRALELAVAGAPRPTVNRPRYDPLLLGLTWPSDVLRARIEQRLADRLDAGMVEEARRLLDAGAGHDRLRDLGLEYRYLSLYLAGEIDHAELVGDLGRAIHRFSRRQMSWFRRDTGIHWLADPADPDPEATALVEPFLALGLVPRPLKRP